MTEEVSSKLSLLTRKLAEVGQLKGEIADKLFEEADAGIITKEQALEILDTYNLLPTDGYVSLPPYLDSYEYFERYSKVNYMDYTVPENFDDDIAKAEARRVEYEKFCHGNSELIEEMISTKEYIRDLQSIRDYISFIRDILADLDYSGFSDVLCNID